MCAVHGSGRQASFWHALQISDAHAGSWCCHEYQLNILQQTGRYLPAPHRLARLSLSLLEIVLCKTDYALEKIAPLFLEMDLNYPLNGQLFPYPSDLDHRSSTSKRNANTK